MYNVTMKNQTKLYKYFYYLYTKKIICLRELCALRSKIIINYKKAEDITDVIESIILDYKINDNITYRVLRVYNIVKLSYNSNYTINDLLEVVRVRLEKNHDIKINIYKIKNIIEFKFYNQYNNLIK